MATVTLYIDYKSGAAKEYANAYDIAISSAGVLTFHWKSQELYASKPRVSKFTTSAPFTVEEDVASG